jgi:hypothetical protein
VLVSYCARAFLFRQACRLIEWEGVARMTLRFDAMSTMYCGVRLLGCMSFHAGPGHFQFMDNLQHVAMRNQSPNLRSSQVRNDPCSPSEENTVRLYLQIPHRLLHCTICLEAQLDANPIPERTIIRRTPCARLDRRAQNNPRMSLSL